MKEFPLLVASSVILGYTNLLHFETTKFLTFSFPERVLQSLILGLLPIMIAFGALVGLYDFLIELSKFFNNLLSYLNQKINTNTEKWKISLPDESDARKASGALIFTIIQVISLTLILAYYST